MLRREWTDMDGFLRYRLPNGLYYASAPARWFFFTPLLALFILPGAVAAIPRARRRRSCSSWRGRSSCSCTSAASAPESAARAAISPAACRPAGDRRRMGMASRKATRAICPRSGRARWFRLDGCERGASDAVVCRSQSCGPRARAMDRSADSGARPPGDVLRGPDVRTYSRFDVLNLFVAGESDLAALASSPEPVYLLLDVGNAQTQWRDRSPYRNICGSGTGPASSTWRTIRRGRCFASGRAVPTISRSAPTARGRHRAWVREQGERADGSAR